MFKSSASINFNKSSAMRKLILLIFAISIVFVSCKKDEPSFTERGEIVKTEDKGSYNPTEIQGMLTSKNFDVLFTIPGSSMYKTS